MVHWSVTLGKECGRRREPERNILLRPAALALQRDEWPDHRDNSPMPSIEMKARESMSVTSAHPENLARCWFRRGKVAVGHRSAQEFSDLGASEQSELRPRYVARRSLPAAHPEQAGKHRFDTPDSVSSGLQTATGSADPTSMRQFGGPLSVCKDRGLDPFVRQVAKHDALRVSPLDLAIDWGPPTTTVGLTTDKSTQAIMCACTQQRPLRAVRRRDADRSRHLQSDRRSLGRPP